jgi:hypothetical protein
MEIFMKRVIPNLLLYFCLIPWGAALVFTVIDCIFNMMYLEWLWIPDFCMVVFDMFSYYLIEIAAFASFGIFAAYVFFGRKHRALLLTLLAIAIAFIFPLSRYVIRHLLLRDVMYDIAMLDYFYDDWMFAQTLFLNVLLFLVAVLLTKMFYSLILKKSGELPTKMLSLRNPQNFAALIFCSAAVLLATILFFAVGDFSLASIFALIVEYVVNTVRFFVIAFVSFTVVKWNVKVYHKV